MSADPNRPLPPEPRATDLSRADLLRVLARLPTSAAEPVAALLGWQARAQPEPDQPPHTISPGLPRAAPRRTTGEPLGYLTRPAPRYWRVLHCEPLDAANPDEATDDDTQPRPEPPEPEPSAPYDPRLPPLLRPGDWQNLWDQLPPTPRPGRALDLPACQRRLARAQPVRRLPRLPRRGFNRRVALVLERTDALRPAWDELAAAERSLRRLLGETLQGFHLPSGPAGPWLSLDDPGLFGPEAIAADALVVLMGSFGALTSAEIGADWRALLERLRSAGHELLLVPLCPLARTALPPATLLLAPLDPATPGSDRQREALALDALLCALARTWLPDRRRLRTLRQAIPAASLHTELCAYNHPRVGRDAFRLWLRPDTLLPWLRRVEHLPAALRARLQAAIDQSGAGLDANARAVERLQADLIRPGPPAHYRRVAEQAREAADSLGAGGGMGLAQFSSMLPVIAALRHRPDWRAVVQQADQVARAAGGAPISPASGFDRAASHGLHPLGAGLEVRAGAGGLLAIAADAYSVERGPLVDGPPLTDLQALEIYDRDHRWRLEAISRPSWAERIWSDGTTLFAAHADNALFAWRPAARDRPEGLWQPEHNPWPWATEIGVDRFGLWARLEVQGAGQGKVERAAQRLRWIPPGRFLMGSPENEPDRRDNERQHPVTLTRGYWLGDTAVSQALWRAVIGQNPSHFKGDELPVENVSWGDCQGFLARLAELAPGLLPALPTEAQWEHACRAGTRTPFSFGERLDPERANYRGDYPYNGAPKGLYRRTTLAVQHFAPNPWGLYQMHGNVWEWCADWLGEYPDGGSQDSVGPEQGRGRVLRGGAWHLGGRSLRSASRRGYSPGHRGADFGLRLAGGFDPQAGPAGRAGAGAMTADDREQSDRALGGQGVGEGVAVQRGAVGSGVIKALRDRLLPKRWR